MPKKKQFEQRPFERIIENFTEGMFELVPPSKNIDLETILKSDFDKYVNWIMNKKSSAAWRSPSEKEPALKDLPGNPKENFPYWRERSLQEEIDFKKSRYENSVLPLETIREQEVARVCEKINSRYAVQLLDIMEGRLTEDYYEVAKLIGKVDYLKLMFVGEEQKKESKPIINRTLPDLFESKEIFEKCLNVLHDLKIIDKSNNYIGKYKAAFVIWINQLQERRIISHTNDKEYSKLLSSYFPNFIISEGAFRADKPRAVKEYEGEIRAGLSKIKKL